MHGKWFGLGVDCQMSVDARILDITSGEKQCQPGSDSASMLVAGSLNRFMHLLSSSTSTLTLQLILQVVFILELTHSKIDWNQVAADPVLTTNGQRDITNGHAARMRYSRFKKQMEGGTAPAKSRARTTPSTSTPKKPREKTNNITKKESPNKRVKTEDGRKNSSGSVLALKNERAELSEGMGMGALSFASISASASSFTTDAHSVRDASSGPSERRPSAMYPQRAEDEIRVKQESGHHHRSQNANNPASYIRANSVLMMPTPNPSTPRYSASPSPCEQGSQSQSHSFQAGLGDMGMMGDFGMQGFGNGAEGYLQGAGEGFGGVGGYGGEMGGPGEYETLLGGMGIGVGEEGYGIWSQGMDGMGVAVDGVEHRGAEGRAGNVLVKTEERWDDAYRRG